jgi:hypothetical protein
LLHQTNVASQTNVKAIQWTYKGGGAFARLYVDPETGNLVFVGGQIDCHQAGMVNTQGLSATATPACNLSGVKVPVPAGASQIAIKFATREPDPAYGVLVECNWITAKAVTAKTIDGFTVLFDKDRPPPSGATLDWFVVRGAVKT